MRIKPVAAILFVLFSLSSLAADPIPEFFFQSTYKIKANGSINGQQYQSQGSGFGISLKECGRDGLVYLMTAAHVVSEAGKLADDIEVEIQSADFKGRMWAKASVLAADFELDIALLAVERNLPYLGKLAKNDLLKRGDELVVVGSPLGTGITPTFGILVSKEKESNSQDHRWWQGSMAIYFGNSGGPVWDPKRREIVGMAVSSLGSGGKLAPNVVFFIPHTVIRAFIESDATKKSMDKYAKP